MSGLGLYIEAFHFLRPVILGLVPVIAGLWWIVRRTRGAASDLPQSGIAPHLRAALTVGAGGRRRVQPVDGVAALLILLTLGAAGPTWSRIPDPEAAEAAPLVVALALHASMEGSDIAPSRLERAKHKIRDLLERRGSARTALVAYAGTSHVVVPMTADGRVMTSYLAGLTPEVMPVAGDNAGVALEQAVALLADEAGGGAILWVTDGVDPADVTALNAAEVPMAVLAMLPEAERDRGLDGLRAPVVRVSPDDSDIRRLDQQLNAAWRAAQLENSQAPWRDQGPWLAWPAAVLAALWFRRGWTMRWGAVLVALWLLPAAPARADGLGDRVAGWFWTPDQQGQRAMNAGDFNRAAERFSDPMWRGYALYRDGQYADAITVLDRVETAQAAMVQGMAQIRNRSYRAGVAAFETALARDPDYPGAAENLAVAQNIVTYIERVQEQSATGDDTEMTADEVVFDNEEARGQDVETDVPTPDEVAAPLSADQWMNSVDTETGDFLRQRFALEAAMTRTPEEPSQ